MAVESTSETVAARPGFWDRGGFWKAALLALVYVAVNLVVAQVLTAALGDSIDEGGALASLRNVAIELAIPLTVNVGLVLVLVRILGWRRELFGTQPDLRRSWWMWVPVLVVLVWNALSYAAADYGDYANGVVITLLGLGLLIGFAEEVLARGLAVNLLRRGGYSEFWVAVLSSLVFALMHILTVWSSGLGVIVLTIGYTFFFGIAMYFTLRVTRNLIWPILLHASTDPATFLRTGGIDEATTSEGSGLFLVASLSNVLVIGVCLLLVWFIRGRVDRLQEYGIPEPEPGNNAA